MTPHIPQPDKIRALFTREGLVSRDIDTTLILAISAWLIFNSHLEHFYPRPWLAADGLLGNTLFYWVSGYGVQSSLQTRQQRFAPYMARRLLRIYPAAFVVLVLWTVSSQAATLHGARAWLNFLVWPTPFTYVGTIVPIYVLLWLCDRYRPWAAIGLATAALATYSGVFLANASRFEGEQALSLGRLPGALWWAYFWMAAALGALMARAPLVSRPTALRLGLLASVVAAYLAGKFAMVVAGANVAWFPGLHLAVLVACIGAALSVCSPTTVTRALNLPVIGPMLALSANLTLEIYLVHEPLSGWPTLYSIVFPLNVLAIAGLTIIGAIGLHLLTSRLRYPFVDQVSRPEAAA